MLNVACHSRHFPLLWSHSTRRRWFSIWKEAKQRGRNMGTQERNPRLDLQWPDYTLFLPTEKIEKSSTGFRASIGSRKKYQGKSWINFQAAFSTHCSSSQGAQDCFHLYRYHWRVQANGCASKPTKQNASKIGGLYYKTHDKTHHSGPPAGEQLTTLHRVLR